MSTSHPHAMTPPTAGEWSPSSWQQRIALQQPTYGDAGELASATAQLAALPPLVTSCSR
jgi:3-deoxy-7-phosphoheptulonate synthase